MFKKIFYSVVRVLFNGLFFGIYGLHVEDDVHFLTEIKEDELKDLSFLDEPDKESAKESFANILEKLKKSHSDRSKNE